MEDFYADFELTTTPTPALSPTPIDYTESLVSINTSIDDCSSKLDRLTSVCILLFVVLGATLLLRGVWK